MSLITALVAQLCVLVRVEDHGVPVAQKRAEEDWPENELVAEASAPPQQARKRWGRREVRIHTRLVSMRSWQLVRAMGECHGQVEGGPRDDLLARGWLTPTPG